MPSRNLQKVYLENSYYHVYNRGVNKRRIFLHEEDYAVFLNLLKRYLDAKPTKDNKGREYEWLHERLELQAFCLMPNHFHILLYQVDSAAMTRLMRGILTAYTVYFNKKYTRLGPLFQDRFKASLITKDAYLQHISRYIHLNPKSYKTWEFSSYPYYIGRKQAAWIDPTRILKLFPQGKYKEFVSDFESQKKILDELKAQLANGRE